MLSLERLFIAAAGWKSRWLAFSDQILAAYRARARLVSPPMLSPPPPAGIAAEGTDAAFRPAPVAPLRAGPAAAPVRYPGTPAAAPLRHPNAPTAAPLRHPNTPAVAPLRHPNTPAAAPRSALASRPPGSAIIEEPRNDKEWHQLELEVGRLFTAAPLVPTRSAGHAPEAELYAGRAAEIRRMMEAVRDSAKHIVLYGERGIGKTSISNTFWAHQDTVHPPVITARVQAYPTDDFEALWRRSLEELSVAGQQFKYEISADYDVITPDVIRRELQHLRRHLPIILVIDEFDMLKSKEARELTANLLKSLHDHGVNVTVLLIGVAEDIGELVANHQSLRRVLLGIRLERMNAAELNEILDKRLRLTPLTITGDVRSAIVALSCGLPYYVQILGRFSTQNAIKNHRTQIVIEDVEAAMQRFVAESGQSFSDDYYRAVESKQARNIFRDVILACALARADGAGFFSTSDIIEAISLLKPDRLYKPAHVQPHLAQFITDKRGNVLIRRGIESRHRYRFSDATMQPYVIMKAITDGEENLRRRLFYPTEAPMEQRRTGTERSSRQGAGGSRSADTIAKAVGVSRSTAQ